MGSLFNAAQKVAGKKRKLAGQQASPSAISPKKSKSTNDNTNSDQPTANQDTTSKPKINQRTLLITSRGSSSQMRHLLNDLQALMPHSKKGNHFTPFPSPLTRITDRLRRR